MTDLSDIERRLEALERSNRLLKILVMLALVIALAAKLIVIWIVATRPHPVAPHPPPSIAARERSALIPISADSRYAQRQRSSPVQVIAR